MLLRKLMGIFAATLILGSASFAIAGVPDLDLSTASGPAGACVLYNLPDGSGDPLTSAIAVVGLGTTDATISLNLKDGLGVNIANYPNEDMILASSAGGLVACTSGTIADQNTDAGGNTLWAAPLNAGGSSIDASDVTVVLINGAPLAAGNEVPLAHVSADITGDRVVNLSDVQAFSADYFGGVYVFRSDLAFDANVNLSDIVPLAQGYGAVCP